MKKQIKTALLTRFAMLLFLCAQSAFGLVDGDYEYVVNAVDDTMVTITGYTGSTVNLSIPPALGGKQVTEIGEQAFLSRDFLESVSLPESVKKIGRHAFNGCNSLVSITIPSSVTEIGSYTFYGCDSLESVSLSEGVKTIGSSAFANCDSLVSITIPSSVTNIGVQAFRSCEVLAAIDVDPDNNFYSSSGGILFNKAQTVLIQYPSGRTASSYTIPNSVVEIGNWVFADCDFLESVRLPEGLQIIPSYAFYHCDSLESITIPGSVTDIGDNAFRSCTFLSSIYFRGKPAELGADVFSLSDILKVYYRNAAQWADINDTYGYKPVVLWAPFIDDAIEFGKQLAGEFAFNIKAKGINGALVKVETSENPINWEEEAIVSFTSDDDQKKFIGAQVSEHAKRFYRLNMP
jgi:hypothetical protein